MEDKF